MSWTTTATLPERKHGPGWTTSATLPGRQAGACWFALLEKVVPFGGEGDLSAAITVIYPEVVVQFGGSGALAATVAPKKAITAAFTGNGTAVSTLWETCSVAVAFTAASSTFGTEINEGLWAVIEGGAPLVDGLSATIRIAIPGAERSAELTGDGTLAVTVVQTFIATAAFATAGVLSATSTQQYTITAGFGDA